MNSPVRKPPKGAKLSPVKPKTFEVVKKVYLGEIEIDFRGEGEGDSPALAAFRLIDRDASERGDEGEYEFVLPEGPTIRVAISYEGK